MTPAGPGFIFSMFRPSHTVSTWLSYLATEGIDVLNLIILFLY
jgi:hypothetical protein